VSLKDFSQQTSILSVEPLHGTAQIKVEFLGQSPIFLPPRSRTIVSCGEVIPNHAIERGLI
jgi:hypothetical protein